MFLYFMIGCLFSLNFVSTKTQDVLERLLEIERRQYDIERVERENDFFKSKLSELEEKYNKRFQDLEAKYNRRFQDLEAKYNRRFQEMEGGLTECDERGIKMEKLLYNKIDSLERLVSSNHDDVSKQQGSIMKERFYNLVTESKSFKKNENSAFKNTKQEVRIEMKRQDTRFENTQQNEENDTLLKQRSENNISSQKRIINESTVAFMAILNRDLDHLSNGHIIPFPDVRLNERNAFTGFDGIFICPQSGLYLFSYNTFTTKTCGVQFKVNDRPFIETYEHAASSFVENGGATFVVRLNAGDHVWMASDVDGTQLLQAKTYFMGVLLFAC